MTTDTAPLTETQRLIAARDAVLRRCAEHAIAARLAATARRTLSGRASAAGRSVWPAPTTARRPSAHA